MLLGRYMRLEVLEGLVGYHSGENRSTVEASFRAAQTKWRRLQISDEALAMLRGMGYGLQESRRGLRLSGGDVTAAVDFILEQRKAGSERSARRKRVEDWNYERVNYGKTASGNYVDADQLDRLEGLGYDRKLAAEALRRNENRGQDALDELGSKARRRALELGLALQEGLKVRGGTKGQGRQRCPARQRRRRCFRSPAVWRRAERRRRCRQLLSAVGIS
ncbi:hypothetical protein Vretimale_2576 [Volvox reticuliferus]|nr:hypothetical protein Vretimale_2576 [Volvox reticuliferus]